MFSNQIKSVNSSFQNRLQKSKIKDFILPAANSYGNYQNDNFCKQCCQCKADETMTFIKDQNWQFYTEVTKVKFIKIHDSKQENMQGLNDEMKMDLDDLKFSKVENPLEVAGIDIDAILGRFEKYYGVFLEDMRKQMFEQQDIQGVDCKNVMKESSVQLFEQQREQSKRQFLSLETSLRDTLSSVQNIFPTQRARATLVPNKITGMKFHDCPSSNDWRNWFVFNFDIFKKNFKSSTANFKKSNHGAIIVVQNEYDLTAVTSEDEIKDDIEFKEFKMVEEIPKEAGAKALTRIEFAEDPFTKMFAEDTGTFPEGDNGNNDPLGKAAKKAFGPIIAKVGPEVDKQAAALKNMFTDVPARNVAGSVELELTLKYKFYNCSLRHKFKNGSVGVGWDFTPPMALNESKVQQFVTKKDFDTLKWTLLNPNIEAQGGWDFKNFQPTTNLMAWVNEVSKNFNQRTKDLDAQQNEFIMTQKDTLLSISAMREQQRGEECKAMCSCSRFTD